MDRFENKIILITGSARGLGYEMARCFLREKATVILSDVSQKLLDSAADELNNEFPKNVDKIFLDVSDNSSINDAFEYIKDKYKRLDVLVNNAGIQIRCPSVDFSEEDWDKLLNINLKGTFFCSQQAARIMNEKGGAIVNLSSGTSKETTPGRAPYVISKGAINALTAVLGAEWAEDRHDKKAIRVNAVAPGWIETDMVKDGYRLGVVSEKQILSAVPFKRLAEPSEIASVILFLASDEASYITGQTIFVDGGWNALGIPDMAIIEKA